MNTPTPNIENSEILEPSASEKLELSAQEIHELKRLVESKPKALELPYQLKDLPIFEDDKDRFSDQLLNGVPYVEDFERFGGKLKVSFRTMTRQEGEELANQLGIDFRDGIIDSETLYAGRVNLYHLYLQVISLDGVGIKTSTTGTLKEKAKKSIFESMPIQKIYILVGLLSQFENKVSRMSKMALEPDFSAPATDI